MSLQLFANYENTSNSSVFYRLTSVTPYTFTLKLVDTNSYVSNSYIVEYTTDTNSNRILFDKNLTAQVQVSAQVPGTHWFSITAYNDQDFTLYQTLSLSAVIVGSFLSANFIAYPQGFITPYSPQYRYSSNYVSEAAYLADLKTYQYGNIGNAFYGEGHTESIGLSSTTLRAGCSASWAVGPYNVISSTSTASVIITSQSNTSMVYPISLRVFNNTFPLNSPAIAYFESLSGAPSFYPYYASSLSTDGVTQNPNNTTFRSCLSVLQYPAPNPITDNYIVTTIPSISGFVDLPLDSSGELFAAYIKPPIYDNSVFGQYYAGAQWSLNATANPASTTPDWALTTAILSSTIQQFNFQLSYYNQDYITNALLRASIGYTTQFNLSAIAVKGIYIPTRSGSDRYNPGKDWVARYQYIPYSFSANIDPLPVTNIYTPNYYNLTGTNVYFTNVWSNSTVKAIPISTTVLYKDLSTAPLVEGELGSLYFDSKDIGVIDLSAVTTFNDLSGNLYKTKYHNPGIFEIVNRYDDVETNHYRSELSPLILTHNTAPRLSPNEWVTSDNVNSIIDKFNICINELDQYSSLYQNANKITGRLLQEYIQDLYTTVLTLTSINVLDGSITSFNTNPIYTIETPLSGIVTFGATLSANLVTTLVPTLVEVPPGYRYTWIVPTIDPIAFANWPTPQLSSSNESFVDMVPLEQTGQLIFAHQNSLNLIENQYQTYIANTEVSVDAIFAFQKIQAIGATSNDYVVVLDSGLPRVSVYTITNNQFNLFTTWGRAGMQQSKQGFNKPTDLHIDQNNLIWVADYGNNCIKKFTINGKNLLTLTSEYFNLNSPYSVCVDSQENIHALTDAGVYVFDASGNYLFNYTFPDTVVGTTSINSSYNRECVYITYSTGVVKYFRTGVIYNYTINDQVLADESILTGFNSIHQDKYRNLYITVADQAIRIADVMKLRRYKSQTVDRTMWTNEQLYVHKEEYVQPWVYLKSFHRLWDNIELFRNSLFYNETGNRVYVSPTYQKSDLVIGQNEIVTNAVINRLCSQLWTNLRSIINFFNPEYRNVIITPTPTPTFTPTPTPTYTYTPLPTQTYTYTPGPTPTITYPADGIVEINDNTIYFVTSADSTVFMVSGAFIPPSLLEQENGSYLLQENGVNRIIIE